MGKRFVNDKRQKKSCLSLSLLTTFLDLCVCVAIYCLLLFTNISFLLNSDCAVGGQHDGYFLFWFLLCQVYFCVYCTFCLLMVK